MNKVAYELVTIEVDKLYGKPISPDAPDKEVEDLCEYIDAYITSCGWDIEEYYNEYVNRAAHEYLAPLPQPAIDISKMN